MHDTPDILEVMASRRVRQIINSLISGSKTLTELANELSISKPALLKHAKEMQAAGIVGLERIKTGGGRETRYNLNPVSLNLVVREGLALEIASPGEYDFEFPFLCQMPKDERGEVRERMRRIVATKTDISILLAGNELLLLADDWNNETRNAIERAAEPVKCLFWRYRDMNTNDSFTSRIRNSAVVLYAKDGRAFANLGKYKKLDVSK